MASQAWQFQVTRATGRLRPGQSVECATGAACDDPGLGAGFALRGLPGPLAYFARVLPVPREDADDAVRALSVLGHPNVVAPVGVGGTDGEVILVQELPEGEILERWLRGHRDAGRRTALVDVERIFRQVATALRHAHQAGIPHGGVSSRQVRVSRQASGDLQVQVTDFGVFPLLAAHGAQVPLHEWRHLAPEQAVAPARATVAADLFSLGALLAELLTTHPLVPPGGTVPWRELAVARPVDVRSTLAANRPDAPNGVLDLAASLLRARPEERTPASAMDLSRAVQRVSWEPRVAESIDVYGERSAPSESPVPRVPTIAPSISRSFVVSGQAMPRPVVPAPPPAPPSAPAAAPAPALARAPAPPPVDHDATISEAQPLAFPFGEAPAPEGTVRVDLRRSWFSAEQTEFSALPVMDDETPDDEAPFTTSEQPAAQPAARPEARPSVQAGAPGRPVPNDPGYALSQALLHDGTITLHNPDQLAAARDPQSLSDGTVMLLAPPPQPAAHVPFAPAPPMDFTVPDTMPIKLPDLPVGARLPEAPTALGAPLSTRLPPRAYTLPPPSSPSQPAMPPITSAHPALVGTVVVAAVAVLLLILWGVLNG